MEPNQENKNKSPSSPFMNPFLQRKASDSKDYVKETPLSLINHLCQIHNKPFSYICKEMGCLQRLLCDACIAESLKVNQAHKHQIVSLKEFLSDENLVAQLDAFTKQEESVFVPLDDRFHGIAASINNAFNDLRIKIRELLAQAEEKVQTKAKESFLLTNLSKKWGQLKQKYLSTKESFLKALPENQNREIENFLEILNNIEKTKKDREMNDFHSVLQSHREQMDKFLLRTKENIGLLIDAFFPIEKDHGQKKPPIKIDPNNITYQKEVKTDHKLIINAMTYIPKLDQLITASDSGSITAWNSTTMVPVSIYKVHNDAINTLLYAESENLLVSGSRDKSIRLFPVDSQGINIQRPEIFTSHTEPVRSLLLLEGENKFASAGGDPDIRIWDLKTRNLDCIISTKGWKTRGDEMAFIRPERWIAVSGKNDIRIYDYVRRECILTQSTIKNMGSLVFMPEKRLLVAQDDDDRITFWKVDGEKKKLKKETKINLPFSLKKPAYFKCFDASDLILVSMGTNKLAAFNLSTGKICKEYETKLQNTTCLAILSTERKIIVGDSGSNMLGVLQY